MTRVRFERPMASPTRSARAGQILDLPPEEAEQRVKARQCVYVDTPPLPDGTGDQHDGRAPEETGPGQPLEKMTVAQLKEYAAGQAIDLGEASKKAELLDRIVTVLAEREADDDDENGGDGG